MKKIAFFTTIVLFLLSIWGCKKDLQGTLTAARKIEGTWRTNLPIKFYIKTDFCTGVLEDVAMENRDVTMKIKATGDNYVDITMSFLTSNFSIVNQNCNNNNTGYVPDVSPMFLKGTISSTELTISDSNNQTFGVFTFTTDLMEGTWNDSWCMVYCQNVYTETNQFKLSLQH